MELASLAPQRITAAAITCIAILVPAAALTAAGCAAAARLPTSAARPAGPVTAYVANSGSNTVVPVNTATNKAGQPIKVGPGPVALAITPDGKTAYAANSGGLPQARGQPPPGSVTPIRTATGTALQPVKVGSGGGSGPDAIAITPDGETAYVPSYSPGTVTLIRTATNTALKPIKAGTYPVAIAITPDSKTAYVVNNESGTVTPIRIATNTALKPIKVGDLPRGLAITPDGKTAYVTSNGSGTVTPIRTATNTLLKAIKLKGGIWALTIVITDSQPKAPAGESRAARENPRWGTGASRAR